MSGSSHIQQKLKEWSANKLFAHQGDSEFDAGFYRAKGLDGLLGAIADAAVLDGLTRYEIMAIFVKYAYQVLYDKDQPPHPNTHFRNADAVIKAALALHPTGNQKHERI